MPVRQLSLESLQELDLGKASEAFRQQIARAAHDCYNRPGEAKARKVSLEVYVVPVLCADGGCEEVKVQLQITSAVPKLRTKEYTMGLKPSGQTLFNVDDPGDYSRPGMFEALGDDGEPLPPTQAE